jgi:hypothetical protein
MPSFAEYAIRELKKHPQVASALLEFETTKKIPKFSYRKRIDLTIDENVLKAFRAYCSERGLNMSKIIEGYMKKELEKK